MLLCIEPDLSLLEGLKAAVDKHIFGEECHFFVQKCVQQLHTKFCCFWNFCSKIFCFGIRSGPLFVGLFICFLMCGAGVGTQVLPRARLWTRVVYKTAISTLWSNCGYGQETSFPSKSSLLAFHLKEVWGAGFLLDSHLTPLHARQTLFPSCD